MWQILFSMCSKDTCDYKCLRSQPYSITMSSQTYFVWANTNLSPKYFMCSTINAENDKSVMRLLHNSI